MVLYRSLLGSLTRQYQLRCWTSPRRKITRPGLSSSLSVRNGMCAIVLCRNRVGFCSKPLIRRIRVGDVQEQYAKKFEQCQHIKKERSSRRRPSPTPHPPGSCRMGPGPRRDDGLTTPCPPSLRREITNEARDRGPRGRL